MDSYITCIKQVAAHLEILEVFKNTLPSRLYSVLFPIKDLRQTVQTVKRIHTKEKRERQHTGQSTSTTCISIQEDYSHNKRTVSFDT